MEHVWEYNNLFFSSTFSAAHELTTNMSIMQFSSAHTIQSTRYAPKQQQVQLSAIASLIVYKHAQYLNSQQLPTILFSFFFFCLLPLSAGFVSSPCLLLLCFFSAATVVFITSTQIRYMTFLFLRLLIFLMAQSTFQLCYPVCNVLQFANWSGACSAVLILYSTLCAI